MTVTFTDATPIIPPTQIVTSEEVLLELGISEPTDDENTIVSNAITKAVSAVRAHLHYNPIQASRTEYHPQRNLQTVSREGVWDAIGGQAVYRYVSEAATNQLQLTGIPVRSVVVYRDYNGRSGTVAGAFAESTKLTEGVDYWPNYDGVDKAGSKVCRDGILMAIGQWPTESGTVKVVYTGGYTDAEFHGDDGLLDASLIWDATLSEAVRRARRVLVMQSGSAGLPAALKTSERLGDYSYSADSASLQSLMAGDLAPENAMRLERFVNYGVVGI